MPKYKNIIFDLGGVLLNLDYNLTRKAFESLGIKNFDQFYSLANADQLFQELEKGTIAAPDFYNELNKCTGLSLSVEDIQMAWNAMLLDFRESSLEYLETLKPKAQLILLSNTNSIHLDEFYKIYNSKPRKGRFDEYFHHCIYSFETGTRKPDAECYQWVINKTGIDPAETIFIDDSSKNLEGAASLGIKTILLPEGARIENIGLEKMIG